MHSLGVMTVVLLTGVSYWPESDSPDESKAAWSCECILRRLESNEEEWRDVGPRAKDFVKKLIVVDAGKRMTARQALQHHWFTNEAHRGSYERLYERAVKNWETRTRCANIIEDISLPIPNLAAVVSSKKGTVLSCFKDPPKVLPRVVQTTRAPLWSPVSEEREFSGNPSDPDSSAAAMRAPTAVMYVTRGSKPPASGSTLTRHQYQAGEVTTRGYEAYLSATRQALQGQKKRGRAAQHQGEQCGHPGAGKRAKKRAIVRSSQGVTRMRSPNARS
jgi:serine/threonine protein kinase